MDSKDYNEELRRIVRRLTVMAAPRLVRGLSEAEALGELAGELASEEEIARFWVRHVKDNPGVLIRMGAWIRRGRSWMRLSVEIYSMAPEHRGAAIRANMWGEVGAGLVVCGLPPAEVLARLEAAGAPVGHALFLVAWWEVVS